ncbi:unnamed protein product [Amoebophrya sp. A25]|nr:unnamed protein product [Amoebophrya sp. A25]|eukprot:GSA25T00000003001.1
MTDSDDEFLQSLLQKHDSEKQPSSIAAKAVAAGASKKTGFAIRVTKPASPVLAPAGTTSTSPTASTSGTSTAKVASKSSSAVGANLNATKKTKTTSSSAVPQSAYSKFLSSLSTTSSTTGSSNAAAAKANAAPPAVPIGVLGAMRRTDDTDQILIRNPMLPKLATAEEVRAEQKEVLGSKNGPKGKEIDAKSKKSPIEPAPPGPYSSFNSMRTGAGAAGALAGATSTSASASKLPSAGPVDDDLDLGIQIRVIPQARASASKAAAQLPKSFAAAGVINKVGGVVGAASISQNLSDAPPPPAGTATSTSSVGGAVPPRPPTSLPVAKSKGAPPSAPASVKSSAAFVFKASGPSSTAFGTVGKASGQPSGLSSAPPPPPGAPAGGVVVGRMAAASSSSSASRGLGGVAPPPPPEAPAPPPPAEPPEGPPPCANPVCPHRQSGYKMVSYVCRFSKFCNDCRYVSGDPFKPGLRTLGQHVVSRSQKQAVFEIPVYALAGVDIPFNALQLGPMGMIEKELELRCLPDKPVHYKDELSHRWPDSGVVMYVSAPPNFSERRILKIDAVHGEDTLSKDDNVPTNITNFVNEAARLYPGLPFVLKVRVVFNLRAGEDPFRLGIVEIAGHVKEKNIVSRIQRHNFVPYRQDLQRAIAWVEAHAPKDNDDDGVQIVDPPQMSLICPMSMLRIGIAARGRACAHLQSFDLESFVETMRHAPAKRKWVCPLCDVVCLPDRLVLDSFSQNVLDRSAPNVSEVLITEEGKFTPSEFVDDDELELISRTTTATATAFRTGGHHSLAFGGSAAGGSVSATGTAPTGASGAGGQQLQQQQAGKKKKKNKALGGDQMIPEVTMTEITGFYNPNDKDLAARRAVAEEKRVKEEKERLRRQELEEAAERERKKKEGERMQNPRYGWMEESEKCDECGKQVVFHGGIICGRKMKTNTNRSRAPNSRLRGGCGRMVCWRCLRTGERGPLKTTKQEFEDLGEEAWWMHHRCMSLNDERAYYGEPEVPGDDDKTAGQYDQNAEDDLPPAKRHRAEEQPAYHVAASALKQDEQAADDDDDGPKFFAWE